VFLPGLAITSEKTCPCSVKVQQMSALMIAVVKTATYRRKVYLTTVPCLNLLKAVSGVLHE
jgi:hypothetical protein